MPSVQAVLHLELDSDGIRAVLWVGHGSARPLRGRLELLGALAELERAADGDPSTRPELP